MTVTYIQHVHTAGKVGAFLRLLTIWRGGVFKGIWRDLLIFCFLYGVISVIYRLGLSQDESIKLGFERLCVHFNKYGDYIPLGFILGFYVTQVVNRWWLQFTAIPWLDKLSLNLISYLPGTGKEKKIRRHVVRLANLSSILALRRISTGVARRFPTYDHFVEAGLMTEREQTKLEKMHLTTENIHQITWYPIQWAQAMLTQVRQEGMIKSDFLFSILQGNLSDIAAKNGNLLMYAWVNIPLVYTQLVTIAVHVYFLVALFGRQYLNPTMYVAASEDYVAVQAGTPNAVNLVGYDHWVLDFYFPFFTVMQFIFYFGWLKVAEILINPFGDDDDDFDLNYIIDRNFQVSYLMVDGNEKEDDLEEDTFGMEIPPPELPHTLKSFCEKDTVPIILTEDIIKEEDNIPDDDQYKPLFISNSKLSLSMGSPNLSQFSRRLSIMNGAGRMDLFKRSNSLFIPRSVSRIGEDGGGPMYLIPESTDSS